MIKRRVPIKRRRETPRRSRRVRARDYMARVARLPCVMLARAGALATECLGRIEVNHVGARGLGQKCSDDETAPFCAKHHRDWTEYRGYFAHRETEWRRAFAEWAILETRRRLGWQPRPECF